METTTLAGEIANFSLFQLKNKVEQIREMTPEEQADVSEIIQDSALRILCQSINISKGT